MIDLAIQVEYRCDGRSSFNYHWLLTEGTDSRILWNGPRVWLIKRSEFETHRCPFNHIVQILIYEETAKWNALNQRHYQGTFQFRQDKKKGETLSFKYRLGFPTVTTIITNVIIICSGSVSDKSAIGITSNMEGIILSRGCIWMKHLQFLN